MLAGEDDDEPDAVMGCPFVSKLTPRFAWRVALPDARTRDGVFGDPPVLEL